MVKNYVEGEYVENELDLFLGGCSYATQEHHLGKNAEAAFEVAREEHENFCTFLKETH